MESASYGICALVVFASEIRNSVSDCQFSPAGQSLIQPLLEPFEHNLGQHSPIKRLFHPTVGQPRPQGAFPWLPALDPNQPLAR